MTSWFVTCLSSQNVSCSIKPRVSLSLNIPIHQRMKIKEWYYFWNKLLGEWWSLLSNWYGNPIRDMLCHTVTVKKRLLHIHYFTFKHILSSFCFIQFLKFFQFFPVRRGDKCFFVFVHFPFSLSFFLNEPFVPVLIFPFSLFSLCQQCLNIPWLDQKATFINETVVNKMYKYKTMLGNIMVQTSYLKWCFFCLVYKYFLGIW